jgi:hypothetical protein
LRARPSWRHRPSTYRPQGVVPGQRRAHVALQPFQVPAMCAESVANWPRGLIPARYDQTRVLPHRSRRKSEGSRPGDHRHPAHERRMPRLRRYDRPIVRVAPTMAVVVVCTAKPSRRAFAKTKSRRAWSHCILVSDQCGRSVLPTQWIRLQQRETQ